MLDEWLRFIWLYLGGVVPAGLAETQKSYNDLRTVDQIEKQSQDVTNRGEGHLLGPMQALSSGLAYGHIVLGDGTIARAKRIDVEMQQGDLLSLSRSWSTDFSPAERASWVCYSELIRSHGYLAKYSIRRRFFLDKEITSFEIL